MTESIEINVTPLSDQDWADVVSNWHLPLEQGTRHSWDEQVLGPLTLEEVEVKRFGDVVDGVKMNTQVHCSTIIPNMSLRSNLEEFVEPAFLATYRFIRRNVLSAIDVHNYEEYFKTVTEVIGDHAAGQWAVRVADPGEINTGDMINIWDDVYSVLRKDGAILELHAPTNTAIKNGRKVARKKIIHAKDVTLLHSKFRMIRHTDVLDETDPHFKDLEHMKKYMESKDGTLVTYTTFVGVKI